MQAEGWPGCNVTTVKYILQNVTYTGNVMTQKCFTCNPLTHEMKKNDGHFPRYWIENNHEPIVSMETYQAVQDKVQASMEFNKEAHRFTMPSVFSAKLVCPYCGCNYVKNAVKTNKHDGLVESWSCYGKIKKRADSCPSRRIKGDELRAVACIALGIAEFDAALFSRTVQRMTPIDGDLLEFVFYDGMVKTAPIHYFDQSEKKRTDPHTTFFGYQWSRDGYVVIPDQAEAVQLMYQLYAEGMTVSDIRRTILEKGYKSFRGSMSNKLIHHALAALGFRVVALCLYHEGLVIAEQQHVAPFFQQRGYLLGELHFPAVESAHFVRKLLFPHFGVGNYNYVDADSDYDVQSGQKLRKLFCQVGVAFAVAKFLNTGFRVLLANMIHAHLLSPIGGIQYQRAAKAR